MLGAFDMTTTTTMYLFKEIQLQQQQQSIYLKKYSYNYTLCPANSYNANLGRTRLEKSLETMQCLARTYRKLCSLAIFVLKFLDATFGGPAAQKISAGGWTE